jgi:hypothetical protein
MSKAIFEGLVTDENGTPAEVVYVGAEPTYVIYEDGFKYHIDSRKVDEQVLDEFQGHVKDNESLISESVMKLMGKDDIFTKAAVASNVRNFDKTYPQLFENGIPEGARQYLGMLGFRVMINRHGDIVGINMPSATDEEQ